MAHINRRSKNVGRSIKRKVTKRFVIFLQQQTIANMRKLVRNPNRIINLDGGAGGLMKCDPHAGCTRRTPKVHPRRCYLTATMG